MTKTHRPPIRCIVDIEKEHPDEWVKIEVTKTTADGFTALEGRLVAHGKDYNAVSDIASSYFKKYKVKTMYSNYTGEITAEAVLL